MSDLDKQMQQYLRCINITYVGCACFFALIFTLMSLCELLAVASVKHNNKNGTQVLTLSELHLSMQLHSSLQDPVAHYRCKEEAL
jgi:hypothetical protein